MIYPSDETGQEGQEIPGVSSIERVGPERARVEREDRGSET